MSSNHHNRCIALCIALCISYCNALCIPLRIPLYIVPHSASHLVHHFASLNVFKSSQSSQIQALIITNTTHSDKISGMIGDNSFTVKPRLGDYILLNRNQGHLTSHTLFPCPGKLGKGVLVQTTLWGNLILGPTARDTYLPEVMAETAEDIQTFILSKCKALVPTFDPKEVIHAFRGARAKSTRGDWVIEPSAMVRPCVLL
jgi:L-2-hydroxyglutarate oxidase LhgO